MTDYGLSKTILDGEWALRMSDDQGIVNLTSELCRQLGIARLKPSDVIWVERHPAASPYVRAMMPPDIPVFQRGHICLASSVREKLEAEDWRPIIASSLIFTYQLGAEKMSSNLRWTLGCLAYLGGFAIVGKVIGGFFSSLTALFLAVVPLLPVGLVYALRVGKTVYGRMLRADLRTAELIGRERLISTLKKIDNMHLPDVERNNDLRAKRSLRSYGPSLPERIDNLLSGRAELNPP